MDREFIISEKLVQALLVYLQERPFKEVAVGIQALSQLEPLVKETKDSENHVD